MLVASSTDVLSPNEWKDRALRSERELSNLRADLDDWRARYNDLLEASLLQITRQEEYAPVPVVTGTTTEKRRMSPTTSSSGNNPLITSMDGMGGVAAGVGLLVPDHKQQNTPKNNGKKGGFMKSLSHIINGNERGGDKGRRDKKDKEGNKGMGGLLDDDNRTDFALPLAPSTFYQHLPRLEVCPLVSKRNYVTISGPTGQSVGPIIDDESSISSYQDVVAGRTISTYPHIPGNPSRDGDPIADRFAAHVYENRVIACVADGCNWGAKPREAAIKANTAFIEYVNANHETITDVKKAGAVLLNAFESAHNSIMEGKNAFWDAGTTTLLGGVLLEINKGTDKWTPQWEFVCASVGDCKAFCFNKTTCEITDITAGNRLNASDPRDCGGRLGPHLDEGKPDLRNLNLFCCSCEDGDLIIIVTDGIHDNLDPQHLGKLPKDMPKEFNLVGDKWDDVDSAKAIYAKNAYVTELLQSLLKVGEGEVPAPKEVTTRLVNHCIEVTKTSREYMEVNQGKRLPDNYVEFPGKMDHTSALCFRVGRFPTLPEKTASPAPAPTSTSPAPSGSQAQVQQQQGQQQPQQQAQAPQQQQQQQQQSPSPLPWQAVVAPR